MTSYDLLIIILTNIYSVLYALADFLGLVQIFNYFPDIGKIKLVSFFLSLVFGFFLVILIIRINKLYKHTLKTTIDTLIPPAPAKGGLAAKWEEIITHINAPKEIEWKFAVIEADKLMDQVLKSGGYPGETIGERLVNTDKSRLATIDGLWEAHKLRNRIVHDTNLFLRYSEAKQAIELYQKSLEELGAL